LRWLKRILVGVAVFLFALFALLAIAVLTRSHWQKNWVPPDNGIDLAAHWPILKASGVASNSAFDLLRRAVDAESRISIPPDEHEEVKRLNLEPWSDKSFPILSKMLSESEEAMALARAAAAAPNPQVPTYLSPRESFSYLTPVMRLNELFIASAAQKAAAGDLAGAYGELETSIAFAQILSRGGVLIHVLVEMVLENRSCRAMRLIALQHDVPEDVAAESIDRLFNSCRTVEPLADTFRMEYKAVPGIVSMFFDPSTGSIFGFNQDENAAASEHQFRVLMHDYGWLLGSTREQVTADLARVYKCLVKAATEPYSAREIEQLQERVVPRMTRRSLILIRDPAGYIIAKITLPTLVPIITRYHRRAADMEATAVVIALRQFEQAEHRTPATLDEIVPKYLPKIPLDPFDAKPLRYRVRPDGKWIVYSVGPNQIDEGGKEPRIEPRKPADPGDIVFCECEPQTEANRLAPHPK
jgi:hypothetical protein